MRDRESRIAGSKEYHNKIREELTGRFKSNLSGFFSVCLVGFLVLFQIGIIILLPFVLQNITVYFYVVLEIFSIVLILNLVNDNRSPSYKISWICIALVLPISGHIMYLLWGGRDSTKRLDDNIKHIMRHGQMFLEHDNGLAEEFYNKKPLEARVSKYMTSQNFPLYANNQIAYYSMGEDAFEAIFNELEKAEKFILINFFIVAEGAIWDTLHEILLKKIKEGVEVKFMYDDFGAKIRTDKHFRKKLEQEGFQVQIFNPIHKYTDKLYMNYRSHQKIVVVDGNVGFTGGYNIADEYANLINRFGTWKDNGIRVEGDAVWGMTVTFLQMWEVCQGTAQIDYEKYRPSRAFPKSDTFCHVVSDGPAYNRSNPIENIYQQMIQYSEQYLVITTPYLIIEDDMKRALITAVQSGVDVRIITPYIPDKKHVKLLTNYNYGYLLKHGVRIYEYKPGFIHAKTILNEKNVIVGTINMDYRSFYLHYENGVWISDKTVVGKIKADMDKTLEQCEEVSYEEWLQRPLFMKMKQVFLNMFSTLM
ncbi:cardiolipin synthase [[Clostridium] polysaccharolyticum]|uniref:Cardiolipin synthase n=1 Tax=[Clostridium] polysaccharolyticum TaxID=29364 RepID=A0A1I0AYY5_9FIRM|nr:cardiolipin synthase [[Clostridium] polysaccharolyticum]SES99761.1 cardiolipin synthase [[Clostridium] polysaccharolyticum]